MNLPISQFSLLRNYLEPTLGATFNVRIIAFRIAAIVPIIRRLGLSLNHILPLNVNRGRSNGRCNDRRISIRRRITVGRRKTTGRIPIVRPGPEKTAQAIPNYPRSHHGTISSSPSAAIVMMAMMPMIVMTIVTVVTSAVRPYRPSRNRAQQHESHTHQFHFFHISLRWG